MLVATKRGAFDVVDAGRGTPLVLVHGFPFDNESWRDDAAALASSMRVIAPSMRGFGGSAPFEGVADRSSIDTMADDVAGVLDALGITEPVVMGGLSMGGYVALSFARRHAARLRGLVLADTRAEPDSEEGRSNRDGAIARVAAGELASFVEGLLSTLLAPSTRAGHPELVESVRAMALRAEPSAVVQALRALRDRPDARPGLATIIVKVLILVGAEDALIPPAASQVMALAVPHGRLQILPGAGHLSNLEQPEAFRAAIAAFVASA